ncbi:unnamed protein product, partial [Mesorhabditis spiculigera]
MTSSCSSPAFRLILISTTLTMMGKLLNIVMLMAMLAMVMAQDKTVAPAGAASAATEAPTTAASSASMASLMVAVFSGAVAMLMK